MRPTPLALPLALLVLAACAHPRRPSSDSTVASHPSTAARVADTAGGIIAGSWAGVVTGREIWTSSGSHDIPTTLRVDPDGTWTMTAGGDEASGEIARMDGDAVLLVGRFTEDGPQHGVEAPVLVLLHRVGPGFLIGSARAYWRGVSVHTGIILDPADGTHLAEVLRHAAVCQHPAC